MMKLSMAIYPPGNWLTTSSASNGLAPEALIESWNLRSGLSNWSLRTIAELKDVKDECEFIAVRFTR